MRDKYPSQRTKYPLPATVSPSGTRCFYVPVPDDPAYIAAFRGALYSLAKPYAWGDDLSHTALDVGARMAEMYDDVQEIDCMGIAELRQCIAGCGIEYREFASEEWHCIDLSGCISELALEAILQAVIDGVISGGAAQPSPLPAPAPDECQIYHVRMNARDRWHCPSPIQSGDTVIVTDEYGGWWDGGGLNWNCPDGTPYLLGACSGNKYHETSDPLNPDGWHMQIVGNYGTTYFDPFTMYTVPSGVDETELYMQANDSPLDDNMGEVSFTVTVCSVGWHELFDFRTGLHGWTIGGGTTQDENGLHVGNAGSYRYLSASFELVNDATITHYKATGTYTAGSYHGADNLRLSYNSESAYVFVYPWDGIENPFAKEATVSKAITNDLLLNLFTGWQNQFTGDGTIETLELWGSGDNPFA